MIVRAAAAAQNNEKLGFKTMRKGVKEVSGQDSNCKIQSCH